MCDPRTRKHRGKRFSEQHERCFYCAFPMWLKAPARFAAWFGISLKEAARFKCTAEHLQALSDGGTSRRENVVAACHFCNHHRHELTNPPAPDRYRALIKARIERGGWHHRHLHKMLAASA